MVRREICPETFEDGDNCPFMKFGQGYYREDIFSCSFFSKIIYCPFFKIMRSNRKKRDFKRYHPLKAWLDWFFGYNRKF
jgi:hypothetical protein